MLQAPISKVHELRSAQEVRGGERGFGVELRAERTFVEVVLFCKVGLKRSHWKKIKPALGIKSFSHLLARPRIVLKGCRSACHGQSSHLVMAMAHSNKKRL